MIDIDSKTHQRNVVLSTFINMPLLITNLVLEKMEPMDLLRARKVCRSLRTAVDKFGFRFGYISFNLRKDKVGMQLSGGTEIIYTKAANGSTNVFHNEQTKSIDGENFVERAAKDFKIVSEHALKIIISNSKDSDIVTTFNKIFKAETCVPVKEIRLWYFSFDEVITILPCFDAKVLKSIELLCITSIDRFERITHLEQWKNAENFELSMSEIASTVILNLFHFKFFHIHDLKEFPAQTAIQIRDDLLRRSTFQSCKIYFVRSKMNPIEIAKVFKPDYVGGNEFKIEYSDGNDKFDILLEYWKSNSNYFQLNVKKL